jgi:hypothetical protein
MVHAAHLNLPLIDQLLASGYLQPNTGGVRGWVFVWSYCMSMDFDIQLTDTLDHTYLYHVIHSNDTKQGDIMMRTMTVDGLVDLSNSAKHLGSLPF